MALVALEGFDFYNGVAANSLTAPSLQMKWLVATTTGVSLVTGRFGGQAVRCSPGAAITNQRITKSNYTSGCAFGWAGRCPTMPTSNVLTGFWALRSSTNVFQMGVRVNNLGGLDVYRMSSGIAGTLLGSTANGLITANNWFYLEMEVVPSTTVGRVTLFLNGTQVLNLTGVNNLNAGASTDIGVFELNNVNGGSTATFDTDDWYEADAATRIGEGKVEPLRPSADTATKNWTPSSGSNNYDRVNETLSDGDTTYVQASSVGDQDLYDIGNLGTSPAAIYGVQVSMIGRKTDAATRAIALTVKSGATSSQGPDYTLGSTYDKFERMLTQDPNTSAAWTVSGVNALQIGPKVTV